MKKIISFFISFRLFKLQLRKWFFHLIPFNHENHSSIMSLETLKYTNNEVTVVWKPKTCIHSSICWKGLIEVFNPKERPWIKIDGANTERIIEQVRKCPSGALSYYMNADKIKEDGPDKVVAESATILKVEVAANGPYLIKSEFLIVNSDGREETKTGTVALCRCGASANKPYCDGSHRKIEFQG
jgi:uncharacterized Fe-S cluster protein YjdI